MTTAAPADPRLTLLAAHLAELEHDREITLIDTAPVSSGDLADRATNVDAHLRLSILEHRIDTLRFEYAETARGARPQAEDRVSLGDIVTLDFGSDVASYLYESVDHFSADTDVLTPGSPLGLAVGGALVGETVGYATRDGRKRTATIRAISRQGDLRASAVA